MERIGNAITAFTVITLIALFFVLTGMVIYSSSVESPRDVCKSVNLEWVPDQKKCMKVTREAV